MCKKGLESSVAKLSSIIRMQGLNIIVKVHCNHFDNLVRMDKVCDLHGK